MRAAKILLALMLMIATMSLPSMLAFEQVKKPLKFQRGRSSTTIEGLVKKGDTHRYEFGADAGQKLSVSITSADNSAAFNLLVDTPYGYNDQQDDNSQVSFRDAILVEQGKPTKDAQKGIDEDRRTFTGELPNGSKQGANSTYAIVVKPTKGDVQYSLTVSIK